MTPYRQITEGEQYAMHTLRMHGLYAAEVARATKRHRSTITREFQRASRAAGITSRSRRTRTPRRVARIRGATRSSPLPTGPWSTRCSASIGARS